MFKIGQTLYTLDGSRQGTVVDIDGNIVYLEQRNGAEVEYPASQLTSERPLNQLERERAETAQVDAALDQLCEEILTKIQPMRDLVARAHENIPFSRPGIFDTLGGQRQLQFAAILFGIPLEQFILHHTQNKLDHLKLVMFAKLGQAVNNS